MGRIIVYIVMFALVGCVSKARIVPPEDLALELSDVTRETVINNLFNNLPRLAWDF